MNIIEQEASEFQGTILRSVVQHKAPYHVNLKGKDFVMFPDVFNPNYAKASLFLLDNLGVKKGDVVLDPFCGCGADAIFAVLEGAARAVAVDKFQMPYLCTRYNVARLGLLEKITVLQGDLFSSLKEEKFDLIIANPPFKRMSPVNDIEGALRDNSYTTLKKFFEQARNFLTENGRIRMVFSNVGEVNFMLSLAAKNGFEFRVVASTNFAAQVSIDIYEMTI